MISTIEVNKACDLCNCLFGPPNGEKVCDTALTAKYAIPVIPFKCPRGYPTTKGYGNGNPAWFNNTRKAVMERIAKVERERWIISELTKNGSPQLVQEAKKHIRAGNRGWVGPISLKEVGKCRS